MSLRDRWEFKYTAKKLAEGARTKKDFHAGRLKFWEEAKAKVMAEIKDADALQRQRHGFWCCRWISECCHLAGLVLRGLVSGLVC